ncbi:MAG TPA: methylmalonyl-CoA epimerase [Candidatus Mcinerneyibacterium sp.]|nr:methylmalonyl-CoA epimerase [Candidatus Mcinerneyibacterium sp.]
MIEKINHIGIAVKKLENHLPFYTEILGLELTGKEEVEEQMVKVAMIKVGKVKIELLEPTSEESPIYKFIQKRGEGIHHIAYQTDDISGEINKLKENDIRMIDKKPRDGAHGTKIAFVHPKSSGRVLTEICEINN